MLTLAIIFSCQKWIITESESANWNFQMYRHEGPKPHPSLYNIEIFDQRIALMMNLLQCQLTLIEEQTVCCSSNEKH